MSHLCKHCSNSLTDLVIDLGNQPPSNSYLKQSDLSLPEVTYPLQVLVCTNCWLVQLPFKAKREELFSPEYAYFSSTSTTWCDHAKDFIHSAIKDLKLNSSSYVIEIGSNDGYLLQYLKNFNIPFLGIEPTSATAMVARSKGINTLVEFFDSKLAAKLSKADLIVANNVLAHVPDLNDFVKGIKILLKSRGIASIEVPHLLKLISENQFDTMYHEHYSYFSLKTIIRIFASFNLSIFDVQELTTHGGSLRVWICHENCYSISSNVESVLNKESCYGLEKISVYNDFQDKASTSKNELVKFLIEASTQNKPIYGYGAAAKGNTLLNYAGVKPDLLPAIADKSIGKQDKFCPGSHIPIISPEDLNELNPSLIYVIPWNLIKEISHQLSQYELFTALPSIQFFNQK